MNSATTTKSQHSAGIGLRVLAAGVLTLLIMAAVVAIGTISRWRHEQSLAVAAEASAAAPPRVSVAIAKPMGANTERVLPGNALPLLEASLFARTTGYLKSRLVDIGDHVEAGQLLAEISAPDIDDQLAQAKANLEQSRAQLKLAEANALLARTTLARFEFIEKENAGAVSKQELDEQHANAQSTAASVENAQATIGVNQALVQRFTDLQNFQKITAPFPGVITARNVDAGDLISADAPSSTKELFHLMRTDTLRVFVNVPQVFALGIQVGQKAVVYQRDEPTKTFPGVVARTAAALDPNTRTLLTEVDVPNPHGELRPGMYLQVKFTFDRDNNRLLIPSAALITRRGESIVAVLDSEHRIQYRPVKLGRDFGAEILVTEGLKSGETVVVHPGDELPAGTVVESVPLK